MTEILLCSEKFFKRVTNISDNVDGKVITSAMREAQEFKLRGVLGDALLDKLVALVRDGSIDSPENAKYSALVKGSQYFLAYSAITESFFKLNYRIGNFGVTTTSDENLQPLSYDDLCQVRDDYQHKADAYCRSLQNFLLRHRADYPELTENHCASIRANLTATASCGMWLGGARGKKIRR